MNIESMTAAAKAVRGSRRKPDRKGRSGRSGRRRTSRHGDISQCRLPRPPGLKGERPSESPRWPRRRCPARGTSPQATCAPTSVAQARQSHAAARTPRPRRTCVRNRSRRNCEPGDKWPARPRCRQSAQPAAPSTASGGDRAAARTSYLRDFETRPNSVGRGVRPSARNLGF